MPLILTVGDTKPSLVYYLKRGGRALVLTEATNVKALLTFSDDSTVTQDATISDAANGKVTVPIVDGAGASVIDVAGDMTVDVYVNWDDADDPQHCEEPDTIAVREAGVAA